MRRTSGWWISSARHLIRAIARVTFAGAKGAWLSRLVTHRLFHLSSYYLAIELNSCGVLDLIQRIASGTWIHFIGITEHLSHYMDIQTLWFKWAPRHEGVLREWKYSSHAFFGIGTRWRWLVSFTPRKLYSQGKSPWYPLDRRLGGLQRQSGRDGEEKNSRHLPGLEPPIMQPVTQPRNFILHYEWQKAWECWMGGNLESAVTTCGTW
jgi:hypothetical protein